jgi:hypothetical protein
MRCSIQKLQSKSWVASLHDKAARRLDSGFILIVHTDLTRHLLTCSSCYIYLLSMLFSVPPSSEL